MKYNNAVYFYRKDAQGNIIALLDSSGNTVVKYRYDAWGNHAVLDANGADIADSAHIGNLNPFRYRGYYYDAETGLYYLPLRYYDPETGRWLNMDLFQNADPWLVNGINLYAYCINNPVNYMDSTGGVVIAGAIALLGLGALIFGGTLILAPKPSLGNPDFSFDIGAAPGTGSIPEIGSGSGAESWDDSKDDIVSPGLNEDGLAKEVSIPSIAVNNIDNVIYALKEKYKPRRCAPRIRSKTKKMAKERAKRAGHKKPPVFNKRHDKNGRQIAGRHYHPGVPDSNPHHHDHYTYGILFILSLEVLDYFGLLD